MKVGILDAALARVFFVDRIVHDHAPADEFVQKKLPHQLQVLFHRELVLQRDIEAVGQLCFRVLLNSFDFVPERFAILESLRGMRGQQNLRADHAALTRVVRVVAVVFAM